MSTHIFSHKKSKLYFVIFLILLGVFSRLIPHAPNFTAILAISAFAGRYFENRWIAAAFPVIALWISDLLIGFHSTMLFVYAAMAMTSLAASFLLRNDFSWIKLGSFSVGGSLIFFFISNIGVWLMDSMYPMTMTGLITCFSMAIPFLINQVAGDFLYMFTTFGLMEMLKSMQLRHRPTTSE